MKFIAIFWLAVFVILWIRDWRSDPIDRELGFFGQGFLRRFSEVFAPSVLIAGALLCGLYFTVGLPSSGEVDFYAKS